MYLPVRAVPLSVTVAMSIDESHDCRPPDWAFAHGEKVTERKPRRSKEDVELLFVKILQIQHQRGTIKVISPQRRVLPYCVIYIAHEYVFMPLLIRPRRRQTKSE